MKRLGVNSALALADFEAWLGLIERSRRAREITGYYSEARLSKLRSRRAWEITAPG